jgi:surface protein
MSYMFADCWVLRSVDLSNFNTAKVTDMSHMFETCTYLNDITIGASFTVGDANTTNTADMFNGTSSMISVTLTVKGSSPSIGQDIFNEIIYAGQLMTENKFELDGVGTSASNFILYKGGLFMKYNDYNIIQPTNHYSVSPAKQIPNEEVVITSVPDENGRIYPPRVYYNDTEGRVNIDVTDLGEGKYSFTMPDSRVFIEAIIYTTLCQLSDDKETLTFWAVEQDEYQQIMQRQMQQQGQGGQQGQQGGQGQGEQSQQQTIMGYSQYISAQKNDNVTDFITACHSQVKTVVFQQSVASALDINGERLLYGFSALTAINGLENLNMKNFTSTEEMFAGCSNLASLTIGSNFYIGDNTTTTKMFDGCTGLADGTLMVNGTTAPVIGQNIFNGVYTNGILITDPATLLDNVITTQNGKTLYKGGVFGWLNKIPNTITFTQADHGEVTSTSKAAEGETVILTITPDTDYELAGLTITYTDGGGQAQTIEATDGDNGTKTFTMPAYPVTITGTFSLVPSEVPYVMLEEDGTTLTFKYGYKPAQSSVWGFGDSWRDDCKDIVTKVQFDASFAAVEVASCANWFSGFTALTTADLANLNTSKVTDFSYMFSGSNNLKTLIIDGGFTVTKDAVITNMFNDTYSHVQLDKLIVMGSTSPTINQDIFEDEGFYIINGGRLETENKFELSDVGWNEVYGLIEYKGGLFDTYNDYHRMEYTMQGFVFECNPKMAVPGTVVKLSRPTDQNYASLTPKASYFNDEGTSVRLTLTETEDGWTFVMPDAHVTISNPSYIAILQLNSDQTALTILAVDRDDVAQMNNAIAYETFLEFQMGGQMAGRYDDDQIAQYNSFVTTCHDKVETVVIDNSISRVRAIWSSAYLFKDFGKLTKVEGLENLNMQNFQSTAYMFAGCSSLSSLTIGSNFYIGAAGEGEQPGFDTTEMFDGCTALAGGTLTVTGTTAPVIEQDIFSGVITGGSLITEPEGLLDGHVEEKDDGKHYKGGIFNTSIEHSENGDVDTGSETVNGVKWVLVYITPKENYELTSVKVVAKDGRDVSEEVELTDVSTPPYIIMKFKKPDYAVSIALKFKLTPEKYYEEITVAAGKEWITYYNEDYDLTLPQGLGLEVYYVSGVTLSDNGTTGTVTLTSTGSKLYKGVPALIHRTEDIANTLGITATGTRHNDGETVRNNMSANYLGTAVDMSLANQTGNIFVLREGAFIKANPSTIAAHRCWISLNAVSASRLVISGETTNMEDIKTSEQQTEWYDLYGRKLDTKPVGKGVYIQNGKKIVVK